MDNHEVPYQRLSIYQTKARLYIVGYCKLRGTAALLKISKQEPTQLDVAEVVGNYSLDEVRTMLSQIHMANAHLGGLQLVTHCCGIIGCFRFTETYYLLLVTRKAHVGSLCGGHKVYTVAATALVPLHPGYHSAGGQPTGAAEKRYVKLLMGMDLTKHFYFSYTYSLAHTVQRNCLMAQQRAEVHAGHGRHGHYGHHGHGHGYGHHGGHRHHHHHQQQHGPSQGPSFPVLDAGGSGGAGPSAAAGSSVYDSMFTWNAYLTSALRRALGGNERWTVPLIHGFWEQRRLSIYGRPLTLTLIARRSRHFAGTRYRKRGLNDGGKVANEVETEQVVDAGIDYRTRTPLLSSVVQVRGSVPLFWSQQLTALSPKPEIILQQFDPLYEVTEAHFADLEVRYGAPAVVLNLLKSKERRPREVLLRRELATAVAQLNAQRGRSRQHIVYIPWDFSKHAKQSGANLLNELAAITRLSLDMTGLFVHNPTAPPPPRRTSFNATLGVLLGSAAATGNLSPQRSGGSVGGAGACPRYGRASFQAGSGGGGSGIRRAVGDGGSHLHLAAAAEAAAAAIRARSAAAATASLARGSRGGGGYASPGRGCSGSGSAAAAASGGINAVQWQSGVLRTNCIDCLDRTNVAQFAFGLVAFGRQLYKLGLHDVRDIDADSSAAFMLMGLYEAMGHVLSLQYGGSEAHTIFFQRKKGEWEAATQSKDLVTSLKRLYSNTYTDAEKQDAINLFLGNFVPQPNQPHLWQLDTDQYLHSETTQRLMSYHQPSSPPSSPQPVQRAASEHTLEALSSMAAAAAAELPGAAASAPTTPHMAVVPPRAALPDLSGASSPSAFARPSRSADGTAFEGSPAAAAASEAHAAAAARFPGLPAEAPLPLELSSDDDDDARSYHEPGSGGGAADAAGCPGGAAGAAGPSSSSAAAAAAAAAYYSAAIPFHRAPSSGGFLASLLPSFSTRGVSAGAAGSGGGLFERVVTSLLQPRGAGAAARAAAAGVAGGDVPGGGADKPGRLLVSFDQALARPPNQVWPIRLHDEEDKQGRWAAVQSAFSFFWTTNAGGAGEGSSSAVAGVRSSNYQLEDTPRPPPRPPVPAAPGTPGTGPGGKRLTSPASPTGIHSPLPSATSGLTSLPMSPEPSRHGGAVNAHASGGGAVPRTVTVGTEGGVSAVSDVSPRATAAGAGVVSGAALEAFQASRPRNLGQVLEEMVDLNHMDEHHGRGTACRTVADTIPALGVAAAADGGRSGGGEDDDGAYYYSAADAEAAVAGQMDGAGARQSSRTVTQRLGNVLNPSGQASGVVSSGGKQGAAASIPVLNDFIEVVGPMGPSTDWRLLMDSEHTMDPAVRRRAVAGAAAKAREEERQCKLLTAGLEVNDMLALGLEDLGLNWELQPWWALEPRPRYIPRPYEPAPGRLGVQRQRQEGGRLELEEEQQQQQCGWERQEREEPGREWRGREPGKRGGEEQQEKGGKPLHQQRPQQQQGRQDLLVLSSDEEEGGISCSKEMGKAEGCRGGNAPYGRLGSDKLPSKAAAVGTSAAASEPVRHPGLCTVRRLEARLAPVEECPFTQPYDERPLRTLQQKQQVEHTAFLHYDVAQLHARAKFSDFLVSVSLPYGLYRDERRRDLALYNSYCYVEQY